MSAALTPTQAPLPPLPTGRPMPEAMETNHKRKYTYVHRVPAPHRPPKSRKFAHDIMSIHLGTCCRSSSCCTQFTVVELQSARDSFVKRACNRADTKAFVKEALISTTSARHATFVMGRQVCVDFFTMLYGVSNNLIYACKGTNKHASSSVRRWELLQAHFTLPRLEWLLLLHFGCMQDQML